MTRTLAYQLAEKGITSAGLLADLSVDELLELADLDQTLAAELIMEAREPLLIRRPKLELYCGNYC